MEVYELMAEMYRLIPEPPHPRQIRLGWRRTRSCGRTSLRRCRVADDLIQFDGTVEDIQTPTTKEIKASHTYIPGGHQFVTEKDSLRLHGFGGCWLHVGGCRMSGMNMSQMVGEVRRLTYGTLTEQLNLIKSDYTALQTEIFLDMDTNQIQPGMILAQT